MELAPLRDASLSAQSFEVLKNAIFTGKLKPGEALRELGLARALKVSQVTIREALFQLEQMGLVVRVPNKGTRVKTLSPEEFAHRFALRVRLEEMAMLEAAKRMSDEDFKALEQLAEQAERDARRNDYHASAQSDLLFHQYIWAKSGNPILCRTLEQLTAPLFVFSILAYQRDQKELAPTSRSHREIVEALRRGNEETIRAAIRLHTEGDASEAKPSGPAVEEEGVARLRISRKSQPRRVRLTDKGPVRA